MSCQPLYAITPKNPSLAAQISEATSSLKDLVRLGMKY
jgi:hypothetical protein